MTFSTPPQKNIKGAKNLSSPFTENNSTTHKIEEPHQIISQNNSLGPDLKSNEYSVSISSSSDESDYATANKTIGGYLDDSENDASDLDVIDNNGNPIITNKKLTLENVSLPRFSSNLDVSKTPSSIPSVTRSNNNLFKEMIQKNQLENHQNNKMTDFNTAKNDSGNLSFSESNTDFKKNKESKYCDNQDKEKNSINQLENIEILEVSDVSSLSNEHETDKNYLEKKYGTTQLAMNQSQLNEDHDTKIKSLQTADDRKGYCDNARNITSNDDRLKETTSKSNNIILEHLDDSVSADDEKRTILTLKKEGENNKTHVDEKHKYESEFHGVKNNSNVDLENENNKIIFKEPLNNSNNEIANKMDQNTTDSDDDDDDDDFFYGHYISGPNLEEEKDSRENKILKGKDKQSLSKILTPDVAETVNNKNEPNSNITVNNNSLSSKKRSSSRIALRNSKSDVATTDITLNKYKDITTDSDSDNELILRKKPKKNIAKPKNPELENDELLYALNSIKENINISTSRAGIDQNISEKNRVFLLTVESLLPELSNVKLSVKALGVQPFKFIIPIILKSMFKFYNKSHLLTLYNEQNVSFYKDNVKLLNFMNLNSLNIPEAYEGEVTELNLTLVSKAHEIDFENRIINDITNLKNASTLSKSASMPNSANITDKTIEEYEEALKDAPSLENKLLENYGMMLTEKSQDSFPIILLGSDNKKIEAHVKDFTKLESIAAYFRRMKNLSPNLKVQFIFDHEKVNMKGTVKDIGLEENDLIEVVADLTRINLNPKKDQSNIYKEDSGNLIKLGLLGDDNKKIYINARPSTTIKKIANYFIEQKGYATNTKVKLFFDHDIMALNKKVGDFDLENDDLIEIKKV
ncbi:uncharacterized protein SCODWIG_02687 [Saccharomycodes ludwigii]|uniref:Rad60/SUMO-like domain-containing protein n=1 Tax=Saccharomycodes ludwigii TaxID=36035 RepID=A0A376B8D5_9ASCO|nr:uncharacterized protein SCODWIG_02687 [Saccharomycodes ludwigii]